MKQRILSDLRIALYAVLAVCLLILIVAELIPHAAPLSVTEPFTVSSSPLDKNAGTYTSVVTGKIRNDSEDVQFLRALTVTLGISGKKQTAEVVPLPDGIAIPPRGEYEICKTFETDADYNDVKTIEATPAEGSAFRVTERDESRAVGMVTVAVFLFIVAVLLLIRACKIRKYLHEENALS